jgi:nitrogen fixation/metabolism regulation signal transduction histidine kinase
MNSSQIKYIRECIAIRKRQLMNRLPNTQVEPKSIKLARQHVRDWEQEVYKEREILRSLIEVKCRQAEENLILGSSDSSLLRQVLAELEAWSPETVQETPLPQ